MSQASQSGAQFIMKTNILIAAALVALPFGAIATPSAGSTSAATAEEAGTSTIELQISGMR